MRNTSNKWCLKPIAQLSNALTIVNISIIDKAIDTRNLKDLMLEYNINLNV